MSSLLNSLVRDVLVNIGLRPFLFCCEPRPVRLSCSFSKKLSLSIHRRKQNNKTIHRSITVARYQRYFLSVEKFFLDGTKVRSITIENFFCEKDLINNCTPGTIEWSDRKRYKA